MYASSRAVYGGPCEMYVYAGSCDICMQAFVTVCRVL